MAIHMPRKFFRSELENATFRHEKNKDDFPSGRNETENTIFRPISLRVEHCFAFAVGVNLPDNLDMYSSTL